MIDSPSQKITYNATIVAPSEFVVSMSGNETGKMELNDTHTATMFECALKIPSYQIALIVGDLVSEALTDRVIIFAEPGVIDAAVAEFEDIPLILNITETYLGPYIWGVYSTFVMPPSFPWGGMEHIKYVVVDVVCRNIELSSSESASPLHFGYVPHPFPIPNNPIVLALFTLASQCQSDFTHINYWRQVYARNSHS